MGWVCEDRQGSGCIRNHLTTPPLAQQVPDKGSGSGTRPLSLHCGSLRHASSVCPPPFCDLQRGGGCGGGDKLVCLRFHCGDETANFLDKPGAFAFLPVTRRSEQWTRRVQTLSVACHIGPHEVLIRVHQCALCSPAVLSQRFCFHMRRWLPMIADSTRREDRTGCCSRW